MYGGVRLIPQIGIIVKRMSYRAYPKMDEQQFRDYIDKHGILRGEFIGDYVTIDVNYRLGKIQVKQIRYIKNNKIYMNSDYRTETLSYNKQTYRWRFGKRISKDKL